MVSIVVAKSRNRVIGRDGRLPWHLPADLRRFRELTSGNTVVMGRRTYESLPDTFRPLPKRRNIVVSANPSYACPGAELQASLRAALDVCGGEGFVIGGSRLYAEALPVADRLYVTEVDAEVEGDVFFPPISSDEWQCVEQSEPLVESGFPFVFRTYERAA